MSRIKLSPETVIHEACILADEDGLDAVTISAVARRLGVRAPSLYAHVRDFSALKDGITKVAFASLGALIAVNTSGRSGFDALRGLANSHRTFAKDSPGQWQSMQRPVGPEVAQSESIRTVVTLSNSVLRDYALSKDEFVHATRFVGATINGYLSLERSGSFDHGSPSPEASWERALEALDISLRNWPRN